MATEVSRPPEYARITFSFDIELLSFLVLCFYQLYVYNYTHTFYPCQQFFEYFFKKSHFFMIL